MLLYLARIWRRLTRLPSRCYTCGAPVSTGSAWYPNCSKACADDAEDAQTW